jgi:hypothetical protein
LEVRLGATSLTVYDGASIVAQHDRSLHKYSQDLVLDHYLEVLSRKPGALAGSTALAAARHRGRSALIINGFGRLPAAGAATVQALEH